MNDRNGARQIIGQLALVILMFPTIGVAQTATRRVLVPGAVCRLAPNTAAAVSHRYRVAEITGAERSTPGVTPGVTWYLDTWNSGGTARPCWVSSEVTVAFDPAKPELAYLAIADRQLTRREETTFESWVEVLNVFENPTTRGTYDGKSLIESSDRLRFTAIRLVEGAANRLEIFHLTPLQEAWVIAHRDLISRQEPDASWRIRPVAYWQLFERNQGAEWADELAWVAAQLVPVTDECGADCHLFIIQEGPQQYWTRIPSGRYLRDALARANLMAVDAITAASYEAPTRVPIDKLRASLANVDPQSKAELLQTLARLERLVK